MIGFPSHVVVDPSDTVRGNAVLPKSVLPTLLAKKRDGRRDKNLRMQWLRPDDSEYE
jgi:hypothetical protein